MVLRALLLAVAVTVLPGFMAQARPSRLNEADHLFWSGKGMQALALYQNLLSECTATETLSGASQEVQAAASAGILRSCLRFGKHDLAEKTLALISQTQPPQAEPLTWAGNYAEYRGRLQEARDYWNQALQADPMALEARYRLAEATSVLSSSSERVIPYRWFLEKYKQNSAFSPTDLEWIGRACVRLEKFEWDGAQKAYKQALDASPALESVLVAKGDLWMDRYDEDAAIKIYAEAIKSNPESLPAFLGLALTQREKGDFSSCKRSVDRILALNPFHPTALALLADLSYYDQQNAEAEEALRKGYATSPNDIVLLSVEATYAIRRNDQARVQQVLEKAAKAYPNPGEFHFQLAECLERNYLFRDADDHHNRCLTLAPWHKRARAAKSMLSGRISPASAENAVEKMGDAFRSDPFHIRLFNMRNLFKKRSEFKKMESEHFILRIPTAGARTYGSLALENLEQTYHELSEKFHYRQSEKILVEFYEDPDDFSVRIAGLPGTGLAGVCFGDIIILSAPGRSRMTGFNWGNNLRHELTHSFTLGLSDARLPRWYTEGLSVVEEWDPNSNSDPILAQRLRLNDLVKVEEMDLAFHRPKNMATVALAYAQSGEVVQALTTQLGFGIHLTLLKEFASGQSTQEVLPRVTGISFQKLNELVRERVEKRVNQGAPPSNLASSPPVDDSLKLSGMIPAVTEIGSVTASIAEIMKPTDNPRLTAWKTAQKEAMTGQWEEALSGISQWLAGNPADLPFIEASAVCAYHTGQKREARKAAGAAIEASSQSYYAWMVLGWLDRDNRRWDRAVQNLMTAHRLRPRSFGSGSPIREAEKILQERGTREEYEEILARRTALSTRDVQGFLELARLRRELEKPDLALQAITQAAFIEPWLPETQVLLGDCLLDLGKPREAIDRYQVAADLDTQNGKARFGMARACIASGSREQAEAFAREAVALDPTLEEAATLLDEITQQSSGKPAGGS